MVRPLGSGALVIDSAPQHLEQRLRNAGSVPVVCGLIEQGRGLLVFDTRDGSIS